jgi:hypothetical protein
MEKPGKGLSKEIEPYRLKPLNTELFSSVMLYIFAKTNSKALAKTFLNSVKISQEHLAIALSQVKLGFWELDLKTGIIECTKQNRINFGFSMDQVLTEQCITQAILPEE